jgi:hypothetical protein
VTKIGNLFRWFSLKRESGANPEQTRCCEFSMSKGLYATVEKRDNAKKPR